MSTTRMALHAIVTAAAVAGPAAAHHSTTMFDTTKEIVLEGVVTDYRWENPHVYLTIRTPTNGDAPVEQVIEVGEPATLLPFGVTPEAVQIGEEVTVRANPAKRGRLVLGRELIKGDNTVLPLLMNPGPRQPAVTPANASRPAPGPRVVLTGE